MRAERLSAALAFLSFSLFPVTHQVVCSDFPSCRTRFVRAKELGRTCLGICVFHTSEYPTDAFFLSQQDFRPPDRGVLPWGAMMKRMQCNPCSYFFVHM